MDRWKWHNIKRGISLAAVVLLVAVGLSACGTLSTPVWNTASSGTYVIGGSTVNATITNGVRWDTNGNLIDAHDGNIYQFGSTYYWYGTSYGCGFDWRGPGSGAVGSPFCGFKEYSSSDLTNWTPVPGWNNSGLMFNPDTSTIQDYCSDPLAASPDVGNGCYDIAVVNDSSTYVAWFNAYGTSAQGDYGVLTSTSPAGPWSSPSFVSIPSGSLLSCKADPVVTTDPQNATAAAGSAVSFSAFSEGNPAPSVQWQQYVNGIWQDIKEGLQADGSFISGVASDVLSIFGVKTDESGNQLRAVFSTPSRTVTTDPATLTVGAPSSTITVTHSPANLTIGQGDTASFTATASGSPTPSVQWQVSDNGGWTWSDLADGNYADGTLVPPGTAVNTVSGTSTNTLSITRAQNADGGLQYRAVFEGPTATAYSDPATLTVDPIEGGAASIYTIPGTSQSYLVFRLGACNGATAIWPLNSSDTGFSGTTPTILDDTTSAGPIYTSGASLAVESTTTNSVITNPSNVTVNIAPNAEATFFSAAGGNLTSVQWWSGYTNSSGTWHPTSQLHNGVQADGSWLSGVTTDAFTISNPQADENGDQFAAVFTTSTGAQTTSMATLTVNENAAFGIDTPLPQTVTVTPGSPVTLYASAAGEPLPSIGWQEYSSTYNGWGAWQWTRLCKTYSGSICIDYYWAWNWESTYYLTNGVQHDGSVITGAGTDALTISNIQKSGNRYRAVFEIPMPTTNPMGTEVPFIFTNAVTTTSALGTKSTSTYNYLIGGYPPCGYCGASTIFDWQSPAMGTALPANTCNIAKNVIVNPSNPCTWFVDPSNGASYSQSDNNVLSATGNPCDPLGNSGQITGLAQLKGASGHIFMAMIDRWEGNSDSAVLSAWPDLAVDENQTRAERE